MSLWFSRIDFDMLTFVAILNPFLDLLTLFGPEIILFDREDGGVASWMSGRRVVVEDSKDSLTKDGGNIDLASIAPKVVVLGPSDWNRLALSGLVEFEDQRIVCLGFIEIIE